MVLTVSLTIKRGRLRWFGHVERKDDADWLKQCMKMEFEELCQGGYGEFWPVP